MTLKTRGTHNRGYNVHGIVVQVIGDADRKAITLVSAVSKESQEYYGGRVRYLFSLDQWSREDTIGEDGTINEAEVSVIAEITPTCGLLAKISVGCNDLINDRELGIGANSCRDLRREGSQNQNE
jgi:hypothetical protein